MHQIYRTAMDAPTFLRLPTEVVLEIASYLPNSEIKSLRLTCRTIHQCVQLRLTRVFLSANKRNIEVFRAIADHNVFRHRITEIVYDDARFAEGSMNWGHGTNGLVEDEDLLMEEWYPEWFRLECLRVEINYLDRWKLGDQFKSSRELRAYYQPLLDQQAAILASNADAEALAYGLKRFPRLKKLTLTPAAHGLLGHPVYETPMIRAIPLDYRYFFPRGWPISDIVIGEKHLVYKAQGWNGDEAQDERAKWRGFSLVLRVLADHIRSQQTRGQIQDSSSSSNNNNNRHSGGFEFVVDTRMLSTGINCRVFDAPCEEYDNLLVLMQQPDFRRLDLTLLADSDYNDLEDGGTAWRMLRSGLLKQALGTAPGLQDLRLHLQMNMDQFIARPGEQLNKHITPLREIFPVDRWTNLRHFGLSSFFVRCNDLLALLAALPPTLRSVELSFLEFTGENAHYCCLLEGIRASEPRGLGWRERVVQPRLTVHVKSKDQYSIWIRCVDKEANAFVYGYGTNPFDVDHDVSSCGTLLNALESPCV